MCHLQPLLLLMHHFHQILNDQGNAYTDYTVFTDSIRDRNGSLLSFSEWQANQIYVFKLKQNLNTTTGVCYDKY